MNYKTINYRGTEVTVSDTGNDIIVNGKHRKLFFNQDGYKMCSIPIDNGEWRSVGVARLVALAYIPNPNNLSDVNHKDYDRTNANVSNLEWLSHEDNIRYSKINMPDYTGKKNPNYNNHKLSQKYKLDPKLSKEKQSRPGAQNGSAKRVGLYYDNKLIKTFDYMIPCLQYLIDLGLTKSSVEGLRSQINQC